jgi:hypothetical protein
VNVNNIQFPWGHKNQEETEGDGLGTGRRDTAILVRMVKEELL